MKQTLSMKQYVFLLMLGFICTAATTVANTSDTKKLICGFETFRPYKGISATWNANPKLQDTAEISVTPGVTGKAMKIVYNYQGDEVCHYGGYHSWMYAIEKFETPQDLSKCDGFSFMIRNTKPKDSISISFYLKDIHGQWIRLMDNNVIQTERPQWEEHTCTLAQSPRELDKPHGHGLQTDIWFGNGMAIDLANITQLAINFFDAGPVRRNGSFTVELDDFCIFEGDEYQTPIKVFDFAKETLEDWKATDNGVPGKTPEALTIGAMLCQWNFRGATKTLDEQIDLRKMAYLKVELESDPIIRNMNPTLDIRMTDAADRTATCLLYGILRAKGKAVGFAPLQASKFMDKDLYDRSCWRYGTYIENYDENKDFDLGSVVKIGIGFEPQDACKENTSATIKIKKLTFGGTAQQPDLERK